MFGRNNIVKVIKKGDLDRLKKILEKKPDIIEKTFHWDIYHHGGFYGYEGNILHMAAFYNQSALVEFLVTEKRMDIAKTYQNEWTSLWISLHHAARNDSYQAIEALLNLGADPNFKNSAGKTPYDYCSDGPAKELLRPYHEAMLKQEAAAARAAGKWSVTASGEVVLERDYPEQHLRLIEIFDVAAEHRTSISKDLETGYVSPPKEESFEKIPDKKMIEQAKAQLAQANGDAPVETRKPQGSGLLLRKASQ